MLHSGIIFTSSDHDSTFESGALYDLHSPECWLVRAIFDSALAVVLANAVTMFASGRQLLSKSVSMHVRRPCELSGMKLRTSGLQELVFGYSEGETESVAPMTLSREPGDRLLTLDCTVEVGETGYVWMCSSTRHC